MMTRPGTLPAATAAIVSLLLAGCSTVETQSFRTVPNAKVDVAYVATDADFSQYDTLLIDDLGIYFPRDAGMTSADIERLRQIFRRQFAAKLQGYKFTREPGPGLLQVTASAIDLRDATAADLGGLRRDLRDIAAPGKLLFVMELRDSGTGKVLGRAGDGSRAPRFSTVSDREPDWQSINEAVAYWATTFRAFLDRNLGSTGN